MKRVVMLYDSVISTSRLHETSWQANHVAGFLFVLRETAGSSISALAQLPLLRWLPKK